jgi:hypothetical protein
MFATHLSVTGKILETTEHIQSAVRSVDSELSNVKWRLFAVQWPPRGTVPRFAEYEAGTARGLGQRVVIHSISKPTVT